MNWNTSNELPFNAQAPQWQPLNLNLNTPPIVPNYNGPQWIQQLTPLVSAAAAIEIQQRAQSNPLRMFMFNQYASNSFQNDDFAALVVGTLDYIALECAAGRFPNPEQAAQVCIPQMCEMLCAINLRLFPALEQFIQNQSLVQTLRNTISNFDQLVARINNWKRTGQAGGQQAQQQGNQWGNQGSSWGNSGGGNTSWGQPAQQAGLNNRWGGNTAPQPSQGSTGLFSNTGNVAPLGGASNSSVVSAKYAGGSSPIQQPHAARVTQPKQESVVNQQEPQEQGIVEAPATSGDIKWVPSAQHPYMPAAAPSIVELWLRKHPNGAVEPFIKEREQSSMDYERHATTTFGPVPRGLDLTHAAETMSRIEQGVKQLNKAAELPVEEKDTTAYTTFIKREMLVDTSESSAWLNGALDRLTAPDGKVSDVYRMYAMIADPIITQHDETDAVLNFGSSKTYIELREKLNSAINEISPELWGAINTKLTNLVNRVLKLNMGLTNLSIDSFSADIQDLISALEKRGKLFVDVFLKTQREQVHSAFLTITDEQIKGFTEDLLAGRTFAENAKPMITFVASNYSFTYLNSVSYELDIELVPGAPALVTSTLTPALNEMLAGLFADVATRGDTFERHLITTIDGRILEATKGFIGDDAYLLTLIK